MDEIRRPRPLMTLQEVARMFQVSEQWVYYQTHHRRIPFLKLGAKLRFEEDALVAWLIERRQGPGGCRPEASLEELRACHRALQAWRAEHNGVKAERA